MSVTRFNIFTYIYIYMHISVTSRLITIIISPRGNHVTRYESNIWRWFNVQYQNDLAYHPITIFIFKEYIKEEIPVSRSSQGMWITYLRISLGQFSRAKDMKKSKAKVTVKSMEVAMADLARPEEALRNWTILYNT